MSVQRQEARSAQKRPTAGTGIALSSRSASISSSSFNKASAGKPLPLRRSRPPPRAQRRDTMRLSLVLLPAVVLVAVGCVFILQPSFIFPSKTAQQAPPAGSATGGPTVTPGSPTVTATPTAQESLQEGTTSRPPVRNAKATAAPRVPQLYSYKVLQTFPHDSSAFTQGLLYYGKTADNKDILYESTGIYGQSTVRRTVLQTGEVLKLYQNDPKIFGEGLTLVDGKLIQVTWKTQQVLEYDTKSLKLSGKATHGMTDGWGLTTDANGRLYGSDGTEFLYHLDPKNFTVTKKVQVRDGKQPIVYLNELESVGGAVWANVWQTPCLAKIDPTSGKVLAWVDMEKMVQGIRANGGRVDVLNGIAWDSAGKRLFVTGKWWPHLFSIRLVPMKTKNYSQLLATTRKKCWPTGGFL